MGSIVKKEEGRSSSSTALELTQKILGSGIIGLVFYFLGTRESIPESSVRTYGIAVTVTFLILDDESQLDLIRAILYRTRFRSILANFDKIELRRDSTREHRDWVILPDFAKFKLTFQSIQSY